MATNGLTHRIKRIYAAIDALQESDLTRLPAKIISGPAVVGLFQNFTGALSGEGLANIAYTAIHNIANLRDHLLRWAVRNGHDKSKVDAAFANSRWLQIITELSNIDKHGYPTRDGSHSRVAPEIAELRREMRLTTGPEAGSRVVMTLTRRGTPKVSGTGTALAVITGDVLDKDGNAIGDLYEIEMKAVEAWEALLGDFGLSLASDGDA